MRTLLKGGQIVNPAGVLRADVLVEGEHITAVGTDLTGADKVLDVAGKLVLPGGVDVHTHLDMPSGGTPTATCDDFYTGSRAAAAGGTTTVVDFAIQYPGESLNQALDNWLARAEGKAAIDYGFSLIMTDVNPATLAEMESIVRRGVTSFKLFTAYPGVFMVDDWATYSVMRQAAALGAMVQVHAENGALIDLMTRQLLTEGKTGPGWHGAAHDALAEVEATHRVLALAEAAGATVYVVHVSVARAMEQIRAARQRGVAAYGETCPHYLFLDDRLYQAPGFEAAKYVMSPPLRDAANQAPLLQALRTGDLQVVATDHCPFNLKGQKELGRESFAKIPNGAPGLEDRMRLLMDAAMQGQISLGRVVEVACTNPARLFGLFPRKGHIGPGADADLVIWDPQRRHKISAATQFMNVDYNMFEGREVQGLPVLTMSRGEVIFANGRWEGVAGRGHYIPRGPSGG